MNALYNLIIKIILIIIITIPFSACSESPTESNITYRPQNFNDGWLISTAEEQGVDTEALDAAYRSAELLENIYSLIVVKNGYLIAESYFNYATLFDRNGIASVTKSFTSAFTGIALTEGILTGTDQKMSEFFPEINFQDLDPRKSDITIQQMLQMRSGYPWEEMDGYLDAFLNRSYYVPLIEEFPLMSDPGNHFGYSNLTAHLMGIILARASGMTLRDFAQTYLFEPLNISVGNWYQDGSGYYWASGAMSFTPRDLAKFGQLYLDNGMYNGNQIIPAEWVEQSLQIYSEQTYNTDIMNSISDLGYGYYWWSGVSGEHHYNFAWGHGGQMIAIVKDLNMVIVTTAQGQTGFGEEVWQLEKAVLEIVGRLIGSL